MANVFKIIVTVLAILAFWGAYQMAKVLTPPPLPVLDENAYWGPGKPKPDDTSIRPFKIQVPDEVLNDLQLRLKKTRTLTPPLDGIHFEYGFNTNTLKKNISFWLNEYNWHQREVFLNSLPQYKTQIQGLDIHYIHIKPKNEKLNVNKTIPLLLLHGWPGSVREFYGLLPLLTQAQPNTNFVFEVIAPSLPGFGFSQAAVRPGLGVVEMAMIFKNLMKRLGHDEFYVHGGDWGSSITNVLATVFPRHILGHHSTMCTARGFMVYLKLILGNIFPNLYIEEKYQSRLYPLSKTFSYLLEETGYLHIQSTKPDTLGVALTDSPAGVAAYYLERFSTWTNPQWKFSQDGGLTNKYSYTDLLDIVMVHWVSNSITTAMRLYAEVFNTRTMGLHLDTISTQVPTACARFKHELIYFPDSMLRHKYPNLIQTSDFEEGGHFSAFEEPQLLAHDIWNAVIKMENNKK